MSNNTIFDDVFRTMIEKMPELVIPLINEAFGTNYSQDTKYDQLRNEHQLASGEIITDSCLRIGNRYYHIECQSSDDLTMAIRMVEYDFHIALENAISSGHDYTMEFPRSCVLYIRGGNIPRFLNVNVIFPDGSKHSYKVPTLKVSDYEEEDILRKKLFLFLPYYILRYEKSLAKMESDPLELNELKTEYNKIKADLKCVLGNDKNDLLRDLMNLIVKVADYVLRKHQSIREELDLMGGKVLQLESERLREEAQSQLADLLMAIRAAGNDEDFNKAIEDADSRKELFQKYGFSK